MLKKQLLNAARLAVRRSSLAPILRRKFRRTPLTTALEIGPVSGWDAAAEWLLSGEGGEALDNPQLHAELRHGINTDIQTEFLLTELRRQLLLGNERLLDQPRMHGLLCSLIRQCINNEYVWYVSEEERRALHVNIKRIEKAGTTEAIDWQAVALLAMYRQPAGLLVNGMAGGGFAQRCMHMPECLQELMQSCLQDYETEQELRKEIQSFDAINQGTSKMIAENYEEYPYPRWISWHFPKTGQRRMRLQKFFAPPELEFLEKPFQVLVAGCGTGSKAIEYAIGYGEHAQILAIDLSKTSLAYAMRMAHKYQVRNIRFLQMDILDLPRLEQQFDIAECTGVLHHMEDPQKGGAALVRAVRNGGIVHISLYSELARRTIVRFRQDYGLASDMSDDEIRQCRREIMQDRPHVIDHELSLRWDFFDLHSCKDLLFHPLEHRFTVPQIAQFLDALGLEFRGFETPGLIQNQYWTHYPGQRDLRNLPRWHDFEEKNPDAFRNLYEIWSKKPP